MSAKPSEIKDMDQGFYFGINPETNKRDIAILQREKNIEANIRAERERSGFITVSNFKHNLGEDGNETHFTLTVSGIDGNTTKTIRYTNENNTLPLQKIVNNSSNRSLKEKIRRIRESQPDFMKVLDIIPHLTKDQMGFFLNKDLSNFTREEALQILAYVSASNNLRNAKSEEEKRQCESALEKILLEVGMLDTLKKATFEYNNTETNRVLGRILEETPQFTEKPAPLKVHQHEAPHSKPIIPSFTKQKKNDGFPEAPTTEVSARKQTDEAFPTRQKEFLEKLNELSKASSEHIKNIKSKLTAEKKKSLFKRSKTLIELREKQLQYAENRGAELKLLLDKTKKIQEGDNKEQDLAVHNLRILKHQEELLNEQFEAKRDRYIKILTTLINSSQDYKPNPENKTTTGWIIRANTTRKKEDAEARATDLTNLKNHIESLEPQSWNDIIALDKSINDFETKLKSYFANNKGASGLSGSGGRINDMLIKAQTEFENLKKETTIDSLRKEKDLARIHPSGAAKH